LMCARTRTLPKHTNCERVLGVVCGAARISDGWIDGWWGSRLRDQHTARWPRLVRPAYGKTASLRRCGALLHSTSHCTPRFLRSFHILRTPVANHSKLTVIIRADQDSPRPGRPRAVVRLSANEIPVAVRRHPWGAEAVSRCTNRALVTEVRALPWRGNAGD
jgi:hypothetical protein